MWPFSLLRGSDSQEEQVSDHELGMNRHESLQQSLLNAGVQEVPILSRRESSILRDDISENLEVTVDVCNLNYYVGGKSKSKKKQILHNINVSFKPGELTCIMGPSGSGKTTLLNCMLGNASGKIEGEVRVNGIPGPPRDFKSIAKLIPQEDVMYNSMTVREVLSYQADLVLPESMSKQKKLERIDNVLDALSLQECADVLIGDVEKKGISGGQRKRTSIALDLLSNPCVMFVDEPTSGLDSKTAEDVVRILHSLAHGTHATGPDGKPAARTVLTTIHQPSYRIFSLFDKVLFLTSGKIAYFGRFSNVKDWFHNRCGYVTPQDENPADYFMQLLQDDDIRGKLCDIYETEYASNKEKVNNLASISQYDAAQEELSIFQTYPADEAYMYQQLQILDTIPKYPSSKWKQFTTLYRRATYDRVKDVDKFFRSILMKFAVGMLIGIVWYGVGSPARNEKIFPLQGAMFSLCLNSVMDTLAFTVIAFPLQRSLLIREYKNGNYSLPSWYFATILSMNLLSIIEVCAISLPVYFLVKLQFTALKFLYFCLILLSLTWIGNALGLVVGAVSVDLKEAQNMIMPIMAPLLLFSGYVLPKAQIPSYFLWLYYASFLQYGITALELNEFTGLEFTDYDIFKGHFFKTGDAFLKKVLDLDPETHHILSYIGTLFLYQLGITTIGYIFIKLHMRKKTG